MVKNQGKDSTIEPAYLAIPPRKQKTCDYNSKFVPASETDAYFNFKNCIEKITFPEGVNDITDDYFRSAPNLTEVIFENKEAQAYIHEYAFADCQKLTTVQLPVTLSYLGEGAFKNCSNLTNINFSEVKSGYQGFPSYCFYNTGITQLSTCDEEYSRYTINTYAFASCQNLSQANLPGVTSISAYAFADCQNLTTVQLPVTLSYLGEGTFKNCSNLTNINLSEVEGGYWDFNPYCFYNTGITSLSTNEECGAPIDDYAFASCQNLSQADLPGVISISAYAFDGCPNLETVHLTDSIHEIGEDAFANCPNLSLITIDKSEESIEGAPWGAENATVVWNG